MRDEVDQNPQEQEDAQLDIIELNAKLKQIKRSLAVASLVISTISLAVQGISCEVNNGLYGVSEKIQRDEQNAQVDRLYSLTSEAKKQAVQSKDAASALAKSSEELARSMEDLLTAKIELLPKPSTQSPQPGSKWPWCKILPTLPGCN